MRAAALLALTALAACQTLPAVVVTGADAFDIRYDAAQTSAEQADARAAAQCGAPATFVSGENRFDGFAYRTYRCVRS
jgi:hypothetical protein